MQHNAHRELCCQARFPNSSEAEFSNVSQFITSYNIPKPRVKLMNKSYRPREFRNITPSPAILSLPDSLCFCLSVFLLCMCAHICFVCVYVHCASVYICLSSMPNLCKGDKVLECGTHVCHISTFHCHDVSHLMITHSDKHSEGDCCHCVYIRVCFFRLRCPHCHWRIYYRFTAVYVVYW